MAFLMKLCTRQVFSRFTEPACLSLRLSISSSVLMRPGSFNDLEIAKSRVSTLSNDPGNEAKLRLYGLFKQATIGKCSSKKPGMMDFVGRAKWDAWNNLGDMTQAAAIDQYCQYVDLLTSLDTGSQSSSTDLAQYKEIVVTDNNGVRTIMLNRPAKYNAITYQMYSEVQHALEEAAKIDSIVVAMLTGAGNYYCSGNDLSNFTNIPPEGPQKLAAQAKEVLREFVSCFIQFPKVLVAAVNGPAVGISVTTLALCDLVYASENASFHTPFMNLGQSPEACSSVLFPRIMGPAKANEVLLGGRKLTSAEALERGLLTSVFPAKTFSNNVKDLVTSIAELPPKSLMKSKQLLRNVDRDLLEKANKDECDLLEERWLSDECMQAIMAFMQRKK
ncbi:enoyl-CoA delta isomerase 2-like [Halichondria panicea]|uniref:enoyl-CoA delta isomerase 2-like n=1 Tax=Halichondria panicea TaxID=6063 RepID=UPI00312B7D04